MNYPKIIKPLLAILVSFALFGFGYLTGHQNLKFEKNFQPKIINTDLSKPRQINFGTFWQAWEIVNKNYFKNPDSQKMVYGAIKGAIDSLGDPYSEFMTPKESKTFFEDLSGSLEGIGAEITQRNEKLIIVAPLAGSPAENSGLKPGDIIVGINHESTQGMGLEAAIEKIRGKAKTKVVLSIIRDGQAVKDFEVIRQKLTINSVEWQWKENNVFYLKVSQFDDTTEKLMNQAAGEVAVKKPQAVILDLRNNPGGYLDAAVNMVGLFVEKGQVAVKQQFRDGHIEETKTAQNPQIKGIKLIVLTNGGSASASEIVAGALKDYNLATIVGEKTFGKGSVQELQELTDGSSIRLTIAHWLTPNGNEINGKGIEPNVKIEMTQKDADANRDPQLDKALELAK